MLYLLVFYMWLFIHRPFEYYPMLGAFQIERGFMFLLLGVWAITPGKVWVFSRLHLAMIFLVSVMTLSLLQSPFYDEKSYMEDYVKFVVFYFVLVTSIRTEKDLRLIIVGFLGSMTLYMGHSLLEYCNGRHEFRMGISRLIGVDLSYNNPNAYATTALTAMPIALALWGGKKESSSRIALLGFIGLATITLLLTGSRAGFVGLCFFGLCCILMARQNRLLMLVVAGAAIGIGLLLPGPLQNRFLTLIDPSFGPQNAEISASGRLNGFLKGIDIWMKSPLLGFGPVKFFGKMAGQPGESHNLYGQLLSTLGLLGTFAFGFFIWAIWRNYRESRLYLKQYPSQENWLPIRVVMMTGLVTLLLILIGWSGHYLYRYTWVWMAAFQTAAIQVIRSHASFYRVVPRLVPTRSLGWAGMRPCFRNN